MANRLAGETSPYLLQHAHNPVDWYPWGEEAHARARELDRPLLVSIGYSACHWCHVMERECFEVDEIAAVMNASFVCIKVDREEHPDVDAICMEACQGMTGHGGWPLNAFLTPGDHAPFFAGTYFPPVPRPGMPSWPQVLGAVADAWQNRRASVEEQAATVARSLGSTVRMTGGEVPETVVHDAIQALRSMFDHNHGGWGGAPKFPAASTIEFLLGAGEREMSVATLRAMAAGGIYDQVGGGFARYAVDGTWTIPHFEKMLYDNALLARAYLHGWQVSAEPRFAEVCEETLDWALREMRGEEGGFCSALDADSEGVEGKFYAWTREELRALGVDGVFEPAPFEHGTVVLRAGTAAPDRIAEARRVLLEARSTRVRPGLDDKRLCSWNALMIAALADAGAVLERDDYVEAARACAAFVLSELRDGNGRLLRTWKDGVGRIGGFLEDHAYLVEALVILYEATFEERWYREAVTVAESMLDRFADPEHGGFFTTAVDADVLVTRRRDLEDHPIPSGSSSAAYGLLRLARLSGEVRYEEAALGVLRLAGPVAARHPTAFGHLLRAIDFSLAPVREVAVTGADGDGAGQLARTVRGRFRPFLVLAGGPAGSVSPPLLEGRGLVDGHAAAYVCERFACHMPVTTIDELEELL